MNELLYTRKAIPTVYKGIQFRSRLEARWAAYFDLLSEAYTKEGSKPLIWHYEPLDLDGWIPDFALERGTVLLLCEIKPIHFIKAFQQLLDWNKIIHAIDALTSAEKAYYIPIVCGLTPHFSWHFLHGWLQPSNPAIPSYDHLWNKACNAVQWRAPK
jgi:hypothetical protein